MDRPMEGKAAMITGAGQGIGRKVALKFASRGAALVLTDKNASALDETARLIRANSIEKDPKAKSMISLSFEKPMLRSQSKSLHFVRTQSHDLNGSTFWSTMPLSRARRVRLLRLRLAIGRRYYALILRGLSFARRLSSRT